MREAEPCQAARGRALTTLAGDDAAADMGAQRLRGLTAAAVILPVTVWQLCAVSGASIP